MSMLPFNPKAKEILKGEYISFFFCGGDTRHEMNDKDVWIDFSVAAKEGYTYYISIHHWIHRDFRMRTAARK